MHAFVVPDCPVNRQVVVYLNGWGRACQNLLFWHYDLNPRDCLYPAPNLRALGPQMRAFVRSSGQGIFLQGTVRNAEFSDLRGYLTTSLIWDPSRDVDQLIDEFLHLYYGKAAAPIRRWMKAAFAGSMMIDVRNLPSTAIASVPRSIQKAL